MANEAITKNDLKKILNEVLPSTPSEYKYVDTLIVNQAYTTGTAGSWVKSVASVVIPKNSVYRVRTAYNNSGVYGVGYSATSATSVVQCTILQENATGASVDVIAWLPAGTWSFWTKCATASKSNNLMIWDMVVTA